MWVYPTIITLNYGISQSMYLSIISSVTSRIGKISFEDDRCHEREKTIKLRFNTSFLFIERTNEHQV